MIKIEGDSSELKAMGWNFKSLRVAMFPVRSTLIFMPYATILKLDFEWSLRYELRLTIKLSC